MFQLSLSPIFQQPFFSTYGTTGKAQLLHTVAADMTLTQMEMKMLY